MNRETKRTIGSTAIGIGTVYLLIHATLKLSANIYDYQHWGVIIAVMLIYFGVWRINSK